MTRSLFVAVCTLLVVAASAAQAQTLGTFNWQLQPFCNVVTVTVTQAGAVYTVDGFDDQCGAPQRAPLVGLATPNPDGSIGFGLSVVTVPGGRGVQIEARISIATLSGSWSDSAGNSGTFVFNANTGGTPRPLPPAAASPIPPSFALRADGGFLAQGVLGTGTSPASGPGTRMMWFPGKAAFRAGEVSSTQWDDANVGLRSTAFGLNTRANGAVSTAMGSNTTANGADSTAMGQGTVANGFVSTAMGVNTTASGFASTAMGDTSLAAGGESVAAGLRVTANGAGSVVLGSDALTSVAGTGTFIFGDRSTANDITGTLPNQFLVRAAGGVVFHSNAALTQGVQLAPNGGQWLGFSDVRAKRDFRDLDGETVLAKLAGMPVQEWSYIAQDAAIRHLGPTAQDFNAAFGLGEDPLRIGSMDADGVALAGVKALEARTSALAAENRALRDGLAAVQAELAELRARR